MNDYIKRSNAIREAIEAADEWDGGYVTSREELIAAYLNDIPAADVVEVVRCGDCRYRMLCYENDAGEKYGKCSLHSIEEDIRDDWFCADGERRSKGV